MTKTTILELLNNAPDDEIIKDSLSWTWYRINDNKYKKIMCSVSGGQDSDIIIDLCTKCDIDNKVEYVWFDTGLEYQATKNHLEYLENKYNIKIIREKAIKPIPVSCKEYGQPFISKQVSQFIEGLQRHNFKFEDKSFDELIKEYPKCKSYLQWWCNTKQRGEDKRFCISQNKWLKEFLVTTLPYFKISSKCCNYAKKDLSKHLIKEYNYDLKILGVRKAEGGQRATAYKSCFDENDKCDNFRPIWWYINNTKEIYNNHYNIKNSDCYSVYGFKRTGCACCPFGNNEVQVELNQIQKYEPKLHLAVNNIFKDSYEYTRQYKEFCKMKNDELKTKTQEKKDD